MTLGDNLVGRRSWAVLAAVLLTGCSADSDTPTGTAPPPPPEPTPVTVSPAADRAALVALYNATDGPNWIDNTNWLTDAPLRDWHGVETDQTGRVVELDLSGKYDDEAEGVVRHGLSGPVPPELGNLASLRVLDLSYNQLGGPIPAELGNLAALTTLDLRINHLSGSIPEALGKLASLTRLSLGWNLLSGPIPPEIGNLAGLQSLNLIRNQISGPIPVELGNLTSLEYLLLNENRLSGSIPATLGSLANLQTVHLPYNDLSGPLPPALGNLASLSRVRVDGNRLSGPVPNSFPGLSLREFSFNQREGAGLCAPGRSDFVAWLRGIASQGGPFCNESDVIVLEALYEATGGPDWARSDGWLADAATEEWHGIRSDSLGRVEAIDLVGNGLSGRLPQSLGQLASMTELRIADNALSGRLPRSLTGLALHELHYARTDLCAPGDISFQDWLAAVSSHEGTGVECAGLSQTEILEALYDVTGGPDWNNRNGWLTDAPLGEWHGVHVDGAGRVTRLRLAGNNLAGPISSELASLASLEVLDFTYNNLTGAIPAQLGNLQDLQVMRIGANNLTGAIPSAFGRLADLRELVLDGNDLTGPIPPELGMLANLRELVLSDNSLAGPIPSTLGGLDSVWRLQLGRNDLTGVIPSELGQLAGLVQLDLGENNLTGTIPEELGDLAGLATLSLAGNDLSGAIPARLGDLVSLRSLLLSANDLAGSVPAELGNPAELRELGLGKNAGLAGALPANLTSLRRLEALVTGGTGLCAPADEGFRNWLAGIRRLQVASCEAEGASMAYLTQAVQSRESPVPLIAGETALLRVFVTAPVPAGASMPQVRARFHVDGSEEHVVSIPPKPTLIPTEIDEGDLDASANIEIPGRVVQPGLEMVIDIDPEGTLDGALGITKRIPETGRLKIDVRAMPTLDLTLIPFLWAAAPDSSVLARVGGMAENPGEHEFLFHARTLLPVGELDVKAHEPVLSSINDAHRLLEETEAIRVMEGGDGHYAGMMTGRIAGAAGLAHRGGRSLFSTANLVGTLAHELGHNMSLAHAPCGDAGGADPVFPQPDGSIGAWGYDFRGRRLIPPTDPDLMGYCSPWWISGYHFTNALRYRLFDEGAETAPSAAASTTSLLLWGGVDADGELHLNPAFSVDAPPALPSSGGDHRLTGQTATGAELFAFDFSMPEVAHGGGSSSFAFVLPVRAAWAGGLARITLSGPGGSFTLDDESDYPMAILRNPRTGQVRGFLRDLPPPTQAAMDAAGRAAGPGLEVLFSRGIPGAEAWRR